MRSLLGGQFSDGLGSLFWGHGSSNSCEAWVLNLCIIGSQPSLSRCRSLGLLSRPLVKEGIVEHKR